MNMTCQNTFLFSSKSNYSDICLSSATLIRENIIKDEPCSFFPIEESFTDLVRGSTCLKYVHDSARAARKYIQKSEVCYKENASLQTKLLCMIAGFIENIPFVRLSEEKNKSLDLISAVRQHDSLKVKTLLENGAWVNQRDNYQMTPLHYAALWGDFKTANMLLKAGADVNAQDMEEVTPLYEAVISRNIRIVHRLIKAGARVNQTDINGANVLHYAIRLKDFQMVQALIESKVNVNQVAIMGITALYEAAFRNDSKIVEVLVEAKANVNAALSNGKTALHDAVAYCNIQMVRTLLAAGANKELSTENGMTALHYAALRCVGTPLGHDLIKMLI